MLLGELLSSGFCSSASHATLLSGCVQWSSPSLQHDRLPQLVFAHHTFPNMRPLRNATSKSDSKSVAQIIFEEFAPTVPPHLSHSWPLCFENLGGGNTRIRHIEKEFNALLKKTMSRVHRLAVKGGGERSSHVAQFGLSVLATPPESLVPSSAAPLFWIGNGSHVAHGPRRMSDDSRAPSRSFLKIEESMHAFFVEEEERIQPGQIVCDLGAAPGGWSYSAALRGGYVIAVDNGPLKGAASEHPRIEHVRHDAFTFTPPSGGCDWLLCDLVENPYHVLRNILEPWISRGWTRRFVVNLKFGRADPLQLIQDVRSSKILREHTRNLRVLHLYHDRQEVTVAGACE